MTEQSGEAVSLVDVTGGWLLVAALLLAVGLCWALSAWARDRARRRRFHDWDRMARRSRR